MLRSRRTECANEKASRGICVAGGGSARKRSRREGRVGIADCRREDRRDALSTKRRPLLLAGFEHEAFHHGAGTGEAGARLPLSYHARNARQHCERSFGGGSRARGARRSKPFESQISLRAERRV